MSLKWTLFIQEVFLRSPDQQWITALALPPAPPHTLPTGALTGVLLPSARALLTPAPGQLPSELSSPGLGLSLILFEPQPTTIPFCLQDRVIINRIDNICHAILKGKWPSSSPQFETQALLAAPAVASSAGSRSGFAESEAPDPSFSNGVLISQVQKVRRALGQGQAWDCGVKRCPEVLRSCPSGAWVFTASGCHWWCVIYGSSHLVPSTEGSW